MCIQFHKGCAGEMIQASYLNNIFAAHLNLLAEKWRILFSRTSSVVCYLIYCELFRRTICGIVFIQ